MQRLLQNLFLFCHRYLETVALVVLLSWMAVTDILILTPVVLIACIFTYWILTRKSSTDYFYKSGLTRSWFDIQNTSSQNQKIVLFMTIAVLILTARTLLASGH